MRRKSRLEDPKPFRRPTSKPGRISMRGCSSFVVRPGWRRARWVTDQRGEEALAEFDESLRLLPTGAALFNRALCLRNLHRYPEAISALDRYLERYADEIDSTRREEVYRMLADIRSLLTEVVLRVTVDGATVVVDDETVGTSPLDAPLRLLSGEHEILVQLDGYIDVRRGIEVVTGREMTVEIELAEQPRVGTLRLEANVPGATVTIDGEEVGVVPYEGTLSEGDHLIEVSAEGYRATTQTVSIAMGEARIVSMSLMRPHRSHRAWFWSAVGLAAAGALTTIGLGVTVHVLDSEYSSTALDASEQYDRGRSLAIGADVALGLTCVSALTALILFFFTDWSGDRGEEERAWRPNIGLGALGWGPTW